MSRWDDPDERFGIDDFTWVPDEPPADSGARRRRGFTAWLWRSVAYSLVIGAGIWVVVRTVGYAVPYPLLVSMLLAASALRRTLAAVAAPRLRFVTEPPPAARVAGIPGELTDGLHQAMNRWNNRLAFTERDAGRFAAAVQPRLVEIVDERLRQRHGVTRAGDPARARQLVGETLWALLHAPVARNPTPRQLAAIVAQVEDL